MAIKRVRKSKKSYATPLELFPDLRPRKIAAPYDHQAQLLRDYSAKGVEASDVAVQGATGSGKTLVGLLIAEWRRRERNERPLYVCPTRQLVHQITSFATEQMGLPAHAFVGRKQDFVSSAKTQWQAGESIGVTTYSALFNVNPFFKKPNFIVVDDAHAADQYIGEYWSVHVRKDKQGQEGIFHELASIIGEILPGDEQVRLKEVPSALSDHLWVQIAPAPLVWEREQAISAVLDQAEDGSDLSFRWSVIKGNLKACQVYVSPYEIMIRPVLPPTGSHDPFVSAKQRLYMSATLGRGGELERLSGRRDIIRIPSPHGWDGHGVGRRLFLFPNASLEESEGEALVTELIEKAGRALYMTPSDRRSGEVAEMIKENLPKHEVFSAQEIEQTKTSFVCEDRAVALIANRYDGIDFPDDQCRMLIVEGRPAGASLQERFLADKLGARALYSERIRTRIVQAFGRCTRSANDYAIVVALGHELLDELLLQENLHVMDVEFQAELQFGQHLSRDIEKGDFLEIADDFYEQGDEWRGAEEDIAGLREGLHENLPMGVDELAAAAPHEIRYVDCLWNGDYATALEAAQAALTALAGGPDLKGYRALWHYLAGCAALLDSQVRGASDDKAHEHFKLAKTVGTVRWLERLNVSSAEPDTNSTPLEDCSMIEQLEANLCELGLTNERPFTTLSTSIRDGLLQNKAKKFEKAHTDFGDLLGYVSANRDDDGAPDPWWVAGDMICIVFEDHSDGSVSGKLAIKKARQVASHPAWIWDNLDELSDDATVLPVLVSDADVSDRNCQTHLKGVAVWRLGEFRDWSNEVLGVIRGLRSKLTRPGDLVWRAEALNEMEAVHATPSSLVAFLQAKLK